jgi:hypothetical protein
MEGIGMAMKVKARGGAALVTVVLAFALSGVAFAAPAVASTPGPTATDIQNIRDLLTKFEVPAGTQDALVQKVVANQLWDVYSKAAKPVVTEHKVIDGFNYTINRYEDGSLSASGLEIPRVVSTTGVTPMSLSQCHYTSGSGYSNATGCQIDGIWGTVLIGAANMSYTLVNGAADKITGYGYGYQKCYFPTTCSSPTKVASSYQEVGSAQAYAKYQADVSATSGSWNVWVQLNVGHDTAWETTS